MNRTNMIRIISPSRYIVDKQSLKSEVTGHLTKKMIQDRPNINIIFVGMRAMKTISKDFAKSDVVHPVLSFDYSKDRIGPSGEEESLLGEVVICYPQAILLATERDRSVNSTISELVIHGVDNLLK